jgi:hypothetical protein
MPVRASAKKSATPAKAAVKAKNQRYEYTELAKVSLTASEQHHVYGVIVDATFPHKVSAEKYVCSLKIVDPSLCSKGAKPTDNDFAQVVIYAKRFEDLPICNRVGDIIRLHRATLRMYQNKRQFNVSTHWNGSWAVFSTDESSCSPKFFSGKRATIEKHETALLASLRKWTNTYFSNNDGVTSNMYSALKTARKASRDFDVVAKILSISEMDEYTNELKIADNTGDNWYVLALKLKFPNLRAGQVVRIRSALFDETSTKQVLVLQHYSNIMNFVSSSRLARAVAGRVSDDWKSDLAEVKKAVPSRAIVLSEVDKKWANTPHTSLNDLFHHDSSLTGNTFRTTFSVVKVEQPTNELCRVYNRSTKKSSSAKGSKGGDLIWQASLLCKDASTANNSNKYRVLVHSHEGLGAEFFGKAANLHSDSSALNRTQHQVDALCKFNTFVDAIVERRNGQYLIRDTRLRL